jgi:hypothetical protein
MPGGGRRASTPRAEPSTSKAYQLRITLLGVRPPIWRRVLVPPSESAEYLHDVIQTAMGWYDSHLHQFLLGERPNYISVEPPDPENEAEHPTVDSRRMPIRTLLRRGGGRALYNYDFGDDWMHEVRLEKEVPLEKGAYLPQCLEGKRACPPEDCGGIYGYADIVRMLKDPTFEPENGPREELLEWLGDEFDPEAFDADAVNAKFRPTTRRSRAKAQSS